MKAIPAVTAAGQRWKVVWEDKGNNADGPVGMDDGSLWIAQNDKSEVVRIDKDGKASVIYTDTYTGGTIAANRKGQIFIGERALHPAIWLLTPQRTLFANTYKGEPFDCLGPGVFNDMSGDSKGGVYFTMGGDGSAVDKDGRIYTTAGASGVAVISPKGELLGNISVPRNLISVTFGGTDKKLLYGVTIRDVQIFSIPTLAQGLKGRPK